MNRYADEINSQLILFNSVLHFKIIPFQNYILHIKSEEGEAGSEDDWRGSVTTPELRVR